MNIQRKRHDPDSIAPIMAAVFILLIVFYFVMSNVNP